VRVGMILENGLRRLSRNSFRTFLHSAAMIEETISRAGLTLSSRRETWMWPPTSMSDGEIVWSVGYRLRPIPGVDDPAERPSGAYG
jgi:hypothetical protein